MIIGSGPNGLSAAIVLAQAGWQTELHEASSHVGGAASSAPLTLPGFMHDIGSAVHPFAAASPFFESLPLDVRWVHSPVPLAHPLDDGTAVLLHRDIAETARGLGADGQAWRNLFQPLVRHWDIYRHELLKPIGPTRHPLLMARLGLNAAWPANALAALRFHHLRAQALFTGVAAHYPFLDAPFSAGFALVLGAAGHTVGWPIPEGGAQSIADSLSRTLTALGGHIVTASPISSCDGSHHLTMADTSPRALAEIARGHLPDSFRRTLTAYRHGPGAFKMDWALREPIPWRAKECMLAATVHVGGTAPEIRLSERAATAGQAAERPFILLSQPTLFDPTRAPAGKHIAWAYCHTPHGSLEDRTAHIENQIERFAPGFRECILARHIAGPRALELANANLAGGDAIGGMADLRQMLFRPTWRRYATPNPRIYLCSASTPPGAGVHGMCGYHAARQALHRLGPP